MGDKSKIEWTEASWNPTVGCTKISAGCKNCYAEVTHKRQRQMGSPKYQEPFTKVMPFPDHLKNPLRWQRPRMIFVNSMSDLFHEDLSNEYIAAVFGVMAASSQHTFQVLTKRAERMRAWFEWVASEDAVETCEEAAIKYLADPSFHGVGIPHPTWPLHNVWLGVSIEDQKAADDRLPHLIRTPALVRMVSLEPQLDTVDLAGFCGPSDGADWNPLQRLNWVIVGGESGPNARPFDIAWARYTVKVCKAAGVPCFVKQDSGRVPGKQGRIPDDLWIKEYPVERTQT